MGRVALRRADVGWLGVLFGAGALTSIAVTTAISRGWSAFPEGWVILALGGPMGVGALGAGLLGARMWVVWAGVALGVLGEVGWFTGWLRVRGQGGGDLWFACRMLGAPGVPVALIAGAVGSIGVLIRWGVGRLRRRGDAGPVCAGCGYSLVGLVGRDGAEEGAGGGGVCPECGRRVG